MPDAALRPDLATEHDVRAVVEAFYRGIAQDPVLGRFFAGVDLAAHVPTLTAFWCSVVFQTGTYRGRPFEKHAALEGLEGRHFAAWLRRFSATVDASFAGPAAERMKARAEQIALIFQHKLGVLEPGGPARPHAFR